MSLVLILAQAAASAFSWSKLIGMAWPVVAAGGGVFASLWASSKLTEAKVERMQADIEQLRRESREHRERLISAEKEIAQTLKAIEVRLGELSTTVSLYMAREAR